MSEPRYSRILISYPRSGRTWLWYMACTAICHHYAIEDPPMRAPLKFRKTELFCRCGIPTASSSHKHYESREPKVKAADSLALLVRNPAALILSYYRQWGEATKLLDWQAHLSHKADDIGRWLQGWANADISKDTLFLPYEVLCENTSACLKSFLDWLGASYSEESIEYAVNAGKFDRMSKLDDTKNWDGRPNVWKKEISECDRSLMLQMLDDHPSKFWDFYRPQISEP